MIPSAGSAPPAAVTAPAMAGPIKATAFLHPSTIAKARTSFRLSATFGTRAIAVGINSAAQEPLNPAARNKCHSCNWPVKPANSGSTIAINRTQARLAKSRSRGKRSANGEPSRRRTSSGIPEQSASAPIASLEPVSSYTSHSMASKPKASPKPLREIVTRSP
ncbi:hypothetical protein D1872_250390 [compost metagenome]